MRVQIMLMAAATLVACADAEAPADTEAATHDLVAVRVFDVAVDAVWDAWRDPEMVERWWGPRGFTVPVAEIDFREGGRSLVCMRAPEEHGSRLFCNTWSYERIEPSNGFEFVLHFTDERGVRIDPSEAGLPDGIPSAVPHLVTFRSLGESRTEMTVVEFGYTTQEASELSKAGLDQSLDKLAEALEGR